MNLQLAARPSEVALFARLRDAATRLGPSVSVWIVGGYPRERLLGRKPALELDLAVAGCSGLAFVRALGRGVQVRSDRGASATLENGHTEIDGVQLDVARLRRDHYTDDSRVPSDVDHDVSLSEDAARRDFTVNALYLDIASGQVLDPLGTGGPDLQARRLRTPMDPLESLRQDPLRLFRGVRFATRLGFELEPAWIAFPQLESYAEFLTLAARKLSGVRVFEELFGGIEEQSKYGALLGPSAVQAWRLLSHFALRTTWLGSGHVDAELHLERVATQTEVERDRQRAIARILLAVLGDDAATVLRNLKTPRGVSHRVQAARELHAQWRQGQPPSDRMLRASWHADPEATEDLLSVYSDGTPGELHRAAEARLAVAAGPPLTARDLLAAGWSQGPVLGAAASAIQSAWLEHPDLDRARAFELVQHLRVDPHADDL